MSSLQEQHDEYMSQFPDKQVTSYDCPNCKTNIACLKPPIETKKPYTSLALCPSCLIFVYKTVYSDGTVDLTRLPKD